MIIKKRRFWAIWFAIFYSYFWLHELVGHYLTNIISGMKMSQMYIDGIKISNIVIWPLKITYTEIDPPRITHFTGGGVAALILLSLSLVFIFIYRKKLKERYFALFSISLGIGTTGLIEMFVEPFFIEYHRSLVNGLVLLIIAITIPIIINIYHFRAIDRVLSW